MIRTILVTMTVALYLIFSVPVLTMLKLRAKRDPVGIQEKSLNKIQEAFHFILRLAGVTYEVQGLENMPSDRVVLYIGNHRSYSDTLIDYVTVPGLTEFVAKKKTLKTPLLRTWMQRVDCLFLDHVDIKEGLKTILEGIERAKSGVSTWIFPKGIRNENQELAGLLPLHEGSLKTVQKSGCPVIPVAIIGTAKVFEQHLSFVKFSHVCMRYGTPIYIKELSAKERKFPGTYTGGIMVGMLKDTKEGQEQDKQPWRIWIYRKLRAGWMRQTLG